MALRSSLAVAIITSGLATNIPSRASAEPISFGAVAAAAFTMVAKDAIENFNDRNRRIAERQSNGANRAVALLTGASVDAFKEHGPMGGPNSAARDTERVVRETGRCLRRMFRRCRL